MSDEFMQNNTNNAGVQGQPQYGQPQQTYQGQMQYGQPQQTYQGQMQYGQPQQTYQGQMQYGQPQQMYQGQPQYGQNYGQPMYQKPQSKGLAIASMVCGIVSCVFCFAWYIVIPTSIVAIVLGIIYKKKGLRNGMATAGIACGVVGLSLFVLIIILAAIGIASASGYANSYRYY